MKEKFIDLGLDEEIALKCVNLFKSELKTQLKEQAKPTEPFDDTAFKTEIADLKKQLKESADSHTKELHSIKLETALEKALTGANAINQKALKPFLTDLDKAEFEENGAIKGLAEQLKALTEALNCSTCFKESPVFIAITVLSSISNKFLAISVAFDVSVLATAPFYILQVFLYKY